MRHFLISFTAQTAPGMAPSPGRSFVVMPEDLKTSRETIETWERQLREAHGVHSIAIHNVVELEA